MKSNDLNYKITIDQAVENIRSFVSQKLDEFKQHWQERAVQEPGNFPTLLSPEDWEEQFDVFITRELDDDKD